MFVALLIGIALSSMPAAPAVQLSSSLVAAAPEGLLAAAANARARYLEGEFSLAVSAAEEADALFVEGAAFSTDGAAWNAWADAQATRAVALARMGDGTGADVVWQGIAVVRPTWSPDKDFVSPKHVARHKALRDGVLSGSTFPVTLEAGGNSEYVFDGRTVVPGSTLDVIPGRHFIGRGGEGRVVIVDAPITLRIGPAVVAAPPVESTITVDDEGPPWLLIGVGAAIVVVTGAVVATVLIVQTTAEPAPTNPGGTSIFVDASTLNRPTTAPVTP